MPTPAAAARGGMFKQLRIVFLLLVLLLVSVTTCQQRYLSTRWREPLFVAIYPIAADDSAATLGYVAGLDAERFRPIDRFFEREARRYGLGLQEPLKTRLRPAHEELPPQRSADAGALKTAAWSLRLRYWAWRMSRHTRDPEDIRIFVLYHDPDRTPVVAHSLGLTKGLLGVVHAFAAHTMDGTNNVVIAHELLHTLGATDKYDPVDDMPLFTAGYGDPHQEPLYPQSYAELMAGRRMLSATQLQEPASLDEVVIGPITALEIHWPRDALRPPPRP